MNVLVDQGSEQRPFPDGSTVRAVDIEVARQEFYRSCLVEGETEKKRQGARRQAFHRAVSGAQGRNLIGVRVLGFSAE